MATDFGTDDGIQKSESVETMEQLQQSSLISGGSAEYLDTLYEQYLTDKNSVAPNWQIYFDSFASQSNANDIAHGPIREYFRQLAKKSISSSVSSVDSKDSLNIEHIHKQIGVNNLITAYRRFGHRHANLDPLGIDPKSNQKLDILTLKYHGLSQSDLNQEFAANNLYPNKKIKLQEVVDALENIYCSTIGYQYQYINNLEELAWIKQKIEGNRGIFNISNDIKRHILQQLTAAEGIEKYLHTKYVGQKRFSLQGGESLIMMLDSLVQQSGSSGYKEAVVAMAHRGRLNVLVNILGKSPAELFAEFEGKAKNELTLGDVKYHQGFSSDVKTPGGNIHLALSFNPSHLEIVTPVAQGSVRARQERREDNSNKEVLLVSIHGDSAFAGQGVVMETFNMSRLRGFEVGGTVHIVINNQVGFTTNKVEDTRSTRYCTDVAKMLEAPVFHVNGDDPEAVLWVTQLALEYKTKFSKDVVIDLICYRRHGHNEADEPSATQPLMYKVIRSLTTTRDLYAEKLISENIITKEQDQDFIDLYRTKLDQGDVVVSNIVDNEQSAKGTDWHKYLSNNIQEPFDSSISKEQLFALANQIIKTPDGFILQAQVKRIIQMRSKMVEGSIKLDWGFAEMLAYASLLDDGYNLRLCGQDSGRGTFAHRHAVLHDQNTGVSYSPLGNIKRKNNRCTIIDSFLSEEAVLAFEYGYSTTDPNTLTIWEAQFGDFANGAQVVIDQFISSGEHKWGRLSGLVLLLPHGYEGMGPEHSSARLERFLQLCAEHNMQVCVPSTPAQVFHMLRRQMLRDHRKPLVVMSPKSLLRHKLATSSLDELISGQFNVLLPEANDKVTPDKVEKVVLCSGKVYYDLIEERDNNNITNIAIIRIEQLYPFPVKQLTELLASYTNASKVIWCQEESKNQGAWYCTAHNLYSCLAPNQKLEFIGRASSSAPAVGYYSMHIEQQNMLVKQVIY